MENPNLHVLICVQDFSLKNRAQELEKFLKYDLKSSDSEMSLKVCRHILDRNVNKSSTKVYDHYRNCSDQLVSLRELQTKASKATYAKGKAQYGPKFNHVCTLTELEDLLECTRSRSRLPSEPVADPATKKQSIRSDHRDEHNYAAKKKQPYLSGHRVEPEHLSDGSDENFVNDKYHYDVVIFLGHSWGLTIENLFELLTKEKPTIVAFLGCRESSVHGDILKISHLLDSKTSPIIGFYQRCIYVRELEQTSLLRGLRYYFFLRNNANACVSAFSDQSFSWSQSPKDLELSTSRYDIARYAFGLAKGSAQSDYNNIDPTVFVNDHTDKESLVQQLFAKSKLSREDVPLSCLQLAMYSPKIVDSNRGYRETGTKNVNVQCIGELDEWCRGQIKMQQLHKLIPLISETGLLNLTKDTLKLIKSGSWEKVDHLQFLVAALRGHWGKNSLSVIKDWAAFHLIEAMRDFQLWSETVSRDGKKTVYSTTVSSSYDDTWQTDNLKINVQHAFRKNTAFMHPWPWVLVKDYFEQRLHRYKLCCICYTFLCDDNFVRFVKPNEKYLQFDIITCTRMRYPFPTPSNHHAILEKGEYQLCDVTDGGYTGSLIYIPRPDKLLEVDPYPDEQKLPWDEIFQYCKFKPNFVQVVKEYYQSWPIKSYGVETVQSYDYQKEDFNLAMRALSDATSPTSLTSTQSQMNKDLQNDYHVKEFKNECDKKSGMMTCFKNTNSYKYYEMRVIPDSSRNKSKVSSCRFVFAHFLNPTKVNEVEGFLYYTDNHYGHNLIIFSQENVDKLKAGGCTKCDHDHITSHPNKSLIKKLNKLCGTCKYNMQQFVINELKEDPDKYRKVFPFVNIGELKLKYNPTAINYSQQFQGYDLKDPPTGLYAS